MQRAQKRSATRDSKKAKVKEPAVADKPATGRLYRWRWPIVILLLLVLSVVVFIASLIPLFNILKIDDGINNLLVFHIGTKVVNTFDDRLEIILVSEQTQPAGPFGQIDPSHRRFYSEMLRTLSDAGAKTVIFDMDFVKQADDKQIDQEFAQTVAQLKNTEVLVAADVDRGTEPRFAPLLEPVLKNRWAIWDGGIAQGTETVRLVRLGVQEKGQENVVGERKVIPSITLHVVTEERFPGQDIQSFFDPFQLEVRLREGGPTGREVAHYPVNKELYFLVDMIGENEMGRHPSFYEVYSQRDNPNYMQSFKDKIVLIGYEKGDVKRTSDAAGKRFGTDIQASAISNLLQNSYIHPLALPYQFLVIVIMSAIGILLRIRFCNLMNYTLPLKIPGFIDWKPQVPVVLLGVSSLYIFIAILAYLSSRTIFSISYDIAALFSAYLITSGICSRLGFK